MVLADDPSIGVPGLTDDAEVALRLLSATLDAVRQVTGVGRILLVHPPDAEARLTARALGFRLWPQRGASAGQRYAAAFQQAIDLGHDGCVVIGLNVPDLGHERITEAVGLLDEHQGAVIGDGDGGIALLALQEAQPTLFGDDALPTYDELTTRAAQQRVRLVQLPVHRALTRETLGTFAASWVS
jgi:glycosyltransferase A (GT-A) superfamily protein (DUF2064 family)